VVRARLDTRNKIIGAGQAAALLREERAHAVVIGYFDPLLAAHARRLAEIRPAHGGLIAVIDDPPDPVLSLHARAELVAALAAVDFVVMGDFPTAQEACPKYDERANDLALRAGLADRIRRNAAL
jgi:bifunctional ADP-heptose synthase (sugar kinase/adenylyltransferase)